jgi:hypothetical protein
MKVKPAEITKNILKKNNEKNGKKWKKLCRCHNDCHGKCRLVAGSWFPLLFMDRRDLLNPAVIPDQRLGAVETKWQRSGTAPEE